MLETANTQYKLEILYCLSEQLLVKYKKLVEGKIFGSRLTE